MPPSIGFPKRLAIVTSQIQQLRGLLDAVVASNPFYQKKFERSRYGHKIRDLGEFSETIPFTTKAEIAADQKNNPPFGTNLTFPMERYTRCHQTSGTSGAPLRWFDTAESWDWMLRNWEQVYRAANVTRADRIFFAFSFGPFLGFWTAFESAARIGALCFPGGGMSTSARLRAILEFQTTVLGCTPSYAMRLAEVAAAENISLAQSPVKLLLVAGEAGGSIPATRARLQELWPGARVFDHHGMTEVGPVTYECPDRPGVLHVNEMAYVAEIVEPATGKVLRGGETGELVLTTLGRVGSPALRYRTGDLVKPSLDSICACGRHDLALEGGILGRVDDMVVVRGVNVYPSAVEEIIRARGGEEYRVRVSQAGTLTELAIEVEFVERANEKEKAAQLERDFEAALALRVPVSVVPNGTLPRPETKAQRWINHS